MSNPFEEAVEVEEGKVLKRKRTFMLITDFSVNNI